MKWHNKLFSLLILCIATFNVNANWQQTQNINLSKGWNAVYISVQTSQQDLALLFADTPIDLVASYFDVASTVQFIDKPTEQSWKSAVWHKWVAPARKDSFLTNLYQLNANRGYLIHVSEDYTWQLTGTKKITKTKWQENAFTLIGFDIDPNYLPSFTEYFSGSTAHQNLVIYGLYDGEWELIDDPANTSIMLNQAYWVYSRGDSTFSSVLSLKNLASTGLNFSSTTTKLTLSIANQGEAPLEFVIQHLTGKDNSKLVPISVEQGTIVNKVLVSDLAALDLPVLNAGEYTNVKIIVDRNQIPQGQTLQSLLLVKGAGAQKIIPISASN